MGEREQAVRDTLPSRPAGVINGASGKAQHCFSGLLHGARAIGMIYPNGGLFIGKAECEWDWQDTWGELKSLGLIEWRVEGNKLIWEVTDKGRAVRSDDNRYLDELVAAMRADSQETAHEA